jgi:hypothetical protein
MTTSPSLPSTPSITFPPTYSVVGIENSDEKRTISGKTEPNTRVRIRITVNGKNFPPRDCKVTLDAWDYDLTDDDIRDFLYGKSSPQQIRVEVQSIDDLGNESAWSEAKPFNLARGKLKKPRITSPAPDSPIGLGTKQISGEADLLGKVRIRFDNQQSPRYCEKSAGSWHYDLTDDEIQKILNNRTSPQLIKVDVQSVECPERDDSEWSEPRNFNFYAPTTNAPSGFNPIQWFRGLPGAAQAVIVAAIITAILGPIVVHYVLQLLQPSTPDQTEIPPLPGDLLVYTTIDTQGDKTVEVRGLERVCPNGTNSSNGETQVPYSGTLQGNDVTDGKLIFHECQVATGRPFEGTFEEILEGSDNKKHKCEGTVEYTALERNRDPETGIIQRATLVWEYETCQNLNKPEQPIVVQVEQSR